MSDANEVNAGKSSVRLYILIAAVLVIIIVVAAVLLISWGLPALRGSEGATSTARDSMATLAPTFTPGPTKEPTNTPPPTPSPTPAPPVMLDTDTPAFEFVSAGARPGVEWTGLFGQVVDSEGNPLPGIPLAVWYDDGTLAADIVRTDDQGNYEIRLADAPLAGTWSIQVLTEDGQPASKLFTFKTDEDTEAGIQQIQVLWQEIP
jgi:hypothetical protein